MAFLAALAVYLHHKFLKEGSTEKKAREDANLYAKKMYKAWAEEDRLTSIQNYIKDIPEDNPHKTFVLACVYHQRCLKPSVTEEDLILNLIKTKAPKAVELSRRITTPKDRKYLFPDKASVSNPLMNELKAFQKGKKREG